ncbi:MAG TPA: prepilin-type N-terminal cleavage/methylation domain-containing protein [Anaerohalosphaeraceae bacterium]|nr:prepilin-type N-terminal cleavage/methylation domain-containing protein [Anaerohalosphaeraceae bacterium]
MSRLHKKAFTLIELLVVVCITSLLVGVLVPALSKVKQKVRSLVSATNQRQIAEGVFCYAADQEDRFPESVAKLGKGTAWSWHEPTVLAGFQKQTPSSYRSVAAYLKDYIDSPSTMFCPSSPAQYAFAQQAWEAGDAWDNPAPNTAIEDPLFGNYCLYWNYVGYLAEYKRPFIGPKSAGGDRRQSQLLISDYFGYGHWRNELAYGTREAFGSCEKIPSASVTPGTPVSCDFWSRQNSDGQLTPAAIDIQIRAGYADGHVESLSVSGMTLMKISIRPDGTIPYPDAISPGGTFYIPRQ